LGQNAKAAGLLDRLNERAAGRAGRRIAILALAAAANSADPFRSISALEEALRLAEPEGYLRTFVDAGEPARRVLQAWLQQSHSIDDAPLREYAQRVLVTFEGLANKPGRPGQITPSAELPEPLSERELEVLQLVAQGLTNQQIADRLVISIRTVKKHVENIHGKLGVQNRTQAVARARDLGLLDE
jgi:LuxR family transcriptional regulator, maltose regulon positive regulatory protein